MAPGAALSPTRGLQLCGGPLANHSPKNFGHFPLAIGFVEKFAARHTLGVEVRWATVVISQAAAELVKHWIERPRPELILRHDLVYSSSFPSGHAMMSPVIYLTLAAFLAASQNRHAVKTLLVVLAFALVMAIGVSRVYLGVHWPADALAAWALGSAIAFAATTASMLMAAGGSWAAQVEVDGPEVT